MEQWLFPALSLVTGLAGGAFGAYLGLRIGVVKLEIHMEDARLDIEALQKKATLHDDDIRIHDFELDDVMRNLSIPRKKRQNWRFE